MNASALRASVHVLLTVYSIRQVGMSTCRSTTVGIRSFGDSTLDSSTTSRHSRKKVLDHDDLTSHP